MLGFTEKKILITIRISTKCDVQGLGLAIGATLLDIKKATTLASVTVMTFMLAGGFFVKVSTRKCLWLGPKIFLFLCVALILLWWSAERSTIHLLAALPVLQLPHVQAPAEGAVRPRAGHPDHHETHGQRWHRGGSSRRHGHRVPGAGLPVPEKGEGPGQLAHPFTRSGWSLSSWSWLGVGKFVLYCAVKRWKSFFLLFCLFQLSSEQVPTLKNKDL